MTTELSRRPTLLMSRLESVLEFARQQQRPRGRRHGFAHLFDVRCKMMGVDGQMSKEYAGKWVIEKGFFNILLDNTVKQISFILHPVTI